MVPASADELGDDPDELVRDLQDRFPKARLIGGDRDYEALVAQVVGLIETPGVDVNLPLDVRGTAFQRRVWQALQEIPVGETVSYRLRVPTSVRRQPSGFVSVTRRLLASLSPQRPDSRGPVTPCV